VILAGIAIGLVLGLLAGGRITNLGSVRLRWVPLLIVALILRFGTELLLSQGVPIVETLRVPLLALSFALLIAGIWVNRTYPGMTLALVGTLSNGLVIILNGGYMPIWEPSLTAAGFTPADVNSSIHILIPATLDASFLVHLGPLSDVIPIPLPIIQNVASVGDLFLMLGLAFFLFASVVRLPPSVPGDQSAGFSPAMAGVVSLERPVVLGGERSGLPSPSMNTISVIGPPVGDRIRHHPYARLAVNSSFSALWAGQLISVLGDRINTIALFVIVSSSAGVVAGSFVFVVAALPNLFLSPVAGTFVDRWDRKEVMVVSDILRAALVLLVPLAVIVNTILVYPLVFLITSISIFFRPARVAILPQIVDQDDLVTANSAMWIGETVADVIGFSLAGLLVAILGAALPLAFWLDAATYLASAVLLVSIVVRPQARSQEDAGSVRPTGLLREMRQGWRFLRDEPTLLANTIQATVGQFTVGVLLALMGAYALQTYSHSTVGYQAALGFLETGVGAGNLLGGFVIGLVGAKLAKGRMIIAGYVGFGLLTLVMALTGDLPLAIGFGFGAGVANMAFIIPSQAMFQQRTPAALMGRVVSFRFALVFGAMTVASGVGSLMLIVLSATTVLVIFSMITIGAGLAGLLVPAIRDA
jgi:MFS family permease